MVPFCSLIPGKAKIRQFIGGHWPASNLITELQILMRLYYGKCCEQCLRKNGTYVGVCCEYACVLIRKGRLAHGCSVGTVRGKLLRGRGGVWKILELAVHKI